MNDNNNQANQPNVTAKIVWMNNDPAAAKKASAVITIDNCFVVHGVSIVEGPKGLFVSMPQRVTEKNGERTYNEVAHPANAATRKAVNDAVFHAFMQTRALSRQYSNSQEPVNQPTEILPVPPIPKEEIEALPFAFEDPEQNEPEVEPDPDEAPIFGQMM